MSAREGFRVAVVGATGLVGRAVTGLLERRDFPVAAFFPFASERSRGGAVAFGGREHPLLSESDIEAGSYDLAFFSAGSDVSKALAKRFVGRGALVIDKSAAFRMDPAVPLVVPEINARRIADHRGIVANPNCSTIQLVMALEPMRRLAPIRRVVTTTFQSVSGTGKEAVEELSDQISDLAAGLPPRAPRVYPHPIAGNCIPHIDRFAAGGDTFEEVKMAEETRKILETKIPLTATCVRVPVPSCHAESVNVEFAAEVSRDALVAALSAFPGVVVEDDPANAVYPLQAALAGSPDVRVGRLRRDTTVPCGYNFWCVADNLMKGAALNGVQIAEAWARERVGSG